MSYGGRANGETATKKRNTHLGGLFCSECFAQGVAPAATHCPKCERRFLTADEMAELAAEAEKTDLDRAMDRLRGVEPQRARLWLAGGLLAAVVCPAIVIAIARRRASAARVEAGVPNGFAEAQTSFASPPVADGTRGTPADYNNRPSPIRDGETLLGDYPPPMSAPPPPVRRKIVACFKCHDGGRCRECYGKGQVYDQGNNTWTRCIECDGSGVCSLCRGRGRLREGELCRTCNGAGVSGVRRCIRCAGTGQTVDETTAQWVPCPECGGVRTVPATCMDCGGAGRMMYQLND